MLVFFVIVIVAALVLERSSLNLSVGRVNYRLEPSKRGVEPDEEFLLQTTVENGAGRSIPFLKVEEILPLAVEPVGWTLEEPVRGETVRRRRDTFFVKKNQRVKRSVRVVIRRRGMFCFRDATLSFGDFLGRREKTRKVRQNRSIVVYPRRLYDERIERVLSDVMGEISVRSFLFEDPILVRGYREYTGREPMRAISFSQSARMEELMVKEFDHTRQETVNLVFDAGYMGNFERYGAQREAAFSLVRTLCEGFEARGVAYRLITNMYYAFADSRGVNVMQSGGTGGSAFQGILEALGAASGVMCGTQELLSHAFLRYGDAAEFLYIAHGSNEETRELLCRLQLRYGVTLRTLYGEEFEPQEGACERQRRQPC